MLPAKPQWTWELVKCQLKQELDHAFGSWAVPEIDERPNYLHTPRSARLRPGGSLNANYADLLSTDWSRDLQLELEAIVITDTRNLDNSSQVAA
jgi:hypothetical protein